MKYRKKPVVIEAYQTDKELERAKFEVYQQERLDKMYHELSGRMDVIQRDLFDLRCKVEGPAEKRATTTEVQE